MIKLLIQLLIDKIKLKRLARKSERQEFIDQHATTLGEEYAGIFYDKYH